MNFLHLPKRTRKMRDYGVTSIADFGIPFQQLKDYLNDFHAYIDFAKLGIGTAYITPTLIEKIKLYNNYNVHCYFGGTLFEKCYLQNKVPEFISSLKQFDIKWIEISNGTVDIPLDKRLQFVSEFQHDFNVIVEIGSKDTTKEVSIRTWIEEIKTFLVAGAKYVITEGRDSGTSGIYKENGQVKTELIEEIINEVDVQKLIFEAPTAKQQMFFINQIGANVNLGNVKITDVLTLEAERLGLRSETLFLEESGWKLHS